VSGWLVSQNLAVTWRPASVARSWTVCVPSSAWCAASGPQALSLQRNRLDALFAAPRSMCDLPSSRGPSLAAVRLGQTGGPVLGAEPEGRAARR